MVLRHIEHKAARLWKDCRQGLRRNLDVFGDHVFLQILACVANSRSPVG